MSLVKYRISELAADLKMQSKDIIEIIGRYAVRPKTAQKVLEDGELDIVFEYLTQQHQVESFENLFAEADERRAKQEEEEKAAKIAAAEEAKNAAAAAAAQVVAAAPAQPVNTPAQAVQAAPAQPVTPAASSQQAAPTSAQAAPAAAQAKPVTTAAPAHMPTKQPAQQPGQRPTAARETRYVDTRGGTTVNMARYDERIDDLVASKVGENTVKSKEKFVKNRPGQKPQLGQKRRIEEQEKLKRLQMEVAAKRAQLRVSIPDEIAVGELASRLKKTSAEVIKVLIRNGIMASASQIIDFDTASVVAMEFNAKIEHEVHLTIEERLIDASQDTEEMLLPRDPIVVVMGHVDHGKTSLLDSIRKTNVVSGEAGGITQHIGAYRVMTASGNSITFLDTPGHAAFTSMRMRGAQVTDIAILVVAADDGIMPQTVEAINHAKVAGVPIIVAINKIDKPTANPDKITQQLTEYELVSEEWGGDTIICPVSAVTGEGIENLLDMVLLSVEMRELRANPNRAATGTVIEAKLDKGRGPVATLLVQNGTLKPGDIIIAGKAVGRIRAMEDDKGKKINEAGPSVPVEVIGLSEAPGAGDRFNAVADERMARELVEQRKQDERTTATAAAQKMSLDDLFAQIQEGNVKDLNIIIKGDVQGSVEAVRSSLEKLSNAEVRVRVIHGGVGAINDSDVMLADASNAIIIGFNVRPDPSAKDSADRAGVDIRVYRVIYECIEEIEAAMKGMLAAQYKEVLLGHAEVRQVFKVTDVGTVAGCMVQDGKIARSAKARIVRDGVIIHEGELSSLKRFKDDVREVASGYECGVQIERYNDIKEGDRIEAFNIIEIKPE